MKSSCSLHGSRRAEAVGTAGTTAAEGGALVEHMMVFKQHGSGRRWRGGTDFLGSAKCGIHLGAVQPQSLSLSLTSWHGGLWLSRHD